VVPPLVVEIGIAAGLMLYGGVGIACLLLGHNFLDYAALDPHHPPHGQHLGILLVELGVGTTVTAVMVAVYYAFTGRKHAELEPEPSLESESPSPSVQEPSP
jgi:multicomponent Na+:H+ antiporter subunit B